MKIIRRILSIATSLLCGTSILGTLPLIAEAETYGEETQYGDYLHYQTVDEDEDGIYDYIEITGCDKSVTEIEIPSEIDDIPVTKIGYYAFSYCKSLKSVTIPDSVTEIGYKAFEDCSSLKSITIPEGVTSIGSSTFEYCTGLESVTIGSGITEIGEDVFWNCTSLESITIPDNVTKIGYEAFRDCSSLKSITIPESVTSIGDSAFWNCTSLESITIPDNVTEIGSHVFYECESLTSIYVSEYNENYSSEDGVLFNKVKTVLIRYPMGNVRTEYTFPNSVTKIGEDAFSGRGSLKSVTIPDSVTEIGLEAFEDCISLENINISDSVMEIGTCAFDGCLSLESITIPDSVTLIGSYAFEYCSSLASITIENPECEINDSGYTICNGYDNDKDESYFNGTIYGYENSTAQAYAEKYGYTFESLGAAPEFLVSDVVSLQKYITNAGTLTEDKAAKYDLNGDGILNAFDVTALKRRILAQQ